MTDPVKDALGITQMAAQLAAMQAQIAALQSAITPGYVTIKEAARIMNCSARTVTRRIDQGTLTAHGENGSRLVLRADVERMAS